MRPTHLNNKDKKDSIDDIYKEIVEQWEEDGQNPTSSMEGVLYRRYINYWDYIHLDTLLSLQTPETHFPDEMMFITYHQITELYFKLILHEINQLRFAQSLDADFFSKKVNRADWLLAKLIDSFDIIAVGMEQDQFIKFRAALAPASGFQSVQYRTIEILSTDFINLVSYDVRDQFDDYTTIDEMFEDIYWKKGSIDTQTGRKSLTLRQFEERYSRRLLRIANECTTRNIYSLYKKLPFDDQKNPQLIETMRRFDNNMNINWSLAHFKYAVRYLRKPNTDQVESTGGTNWRQYLPPKFQKRIFFPSLWSQEEKDTWGKAWVETEVFQRISGKV